MKYIKEHHFLVFYVVIPKELIFQSSPTIQGVTISEHNSKMLYSFSMRTFDIVQYLVKKYVKNKKKYN